METPLNSNGIRYFLQPDIVKDLKQPFKEIVAKNTTEFGSESNDVENIDLSISDSLSSYFNTNFRLDSDPLNDVNDLIQRYRKVATLSYVSDAIDEIIHESIVSGEGDPVFLDFNDKSDPLEDGLKSSIREEFNNILDLLDFDDRGQDYFRQWYVDGRLLMQVILDKKSDTSIDRGIQKIKLMSPIFLKRFYDEKTQEYFYIYDDKKMKNSRNVDVVGKIPDELVVMVPSGIYDGERKIPISPLHVAIKDIQRLDILEDHFLIYRITRAPERRVFYIDPGDLPPKKAEEYLQKIISSYKQRRVFDETTGTLNSRIKHPSMIEDFFLLRRGEKNTEIDTLPSGGALEQIEDLLYFHRKAVNSLHVPFSRLNYEDRQNPTSPTGNDITREEMKFHRFIMALRRKFNVLFFQLLKRQLLYKGIIEAREWESLKRKLVFNYKTDLQFVEAKRLQILEGQLAILRDTEDYIGKYFSTKYVKRNVLNFSKEQIEEIENENREEASKKGQALLD